MKSDLVYVVELFGKGKVRRGKEVVVRRVELKTLRVYPNMFSEDESAFVAVDLFLSSV